MRLVKALCTQCTVNKKKTERKGKSSVLRVGIGCWKVAPVRGWNVEGVLVTAFVIYRAGTGSGQLGRGPTPAQGRLGVAWDVVPFNGTRCSV